MKFKVGDILKTSHNNPWSYRIIEILPYGSVQVEGSVNGKPWKSQPGGPYYMGTFKVHIPTRINWKEILCRK